MILEVPCACARRLMSTNAARRSSRHVLSAPGHFSPRSRFCLGAVVGPLLADHVGTLGQHAPRTLLALACARPCVPVRSQPARPCVPVRSGHEKAAREGRLERGNQPGQRQVSSQVLCTEPPCARTRPGRLGPMPPSQRSSLRSNTRRRPATT